MRLSQQARKEKYKNEKEILSIALYNVSDRSDACYIKLNSSRFIVVID